MSNLALIILNYNSSDDTLTCVRQLKSLGGEYHIIIVDNSSTDNSLKIIDEYYGKDKQIDIIQSPQNGGYSAGNNIGIKYAIEKYNVSTIGILNPDVIIPDINVLQKMEEYLWKNDKFAIVGASVINTNNEYNPNLSAWDIPTSKELVINHFLINKRKYKTRTFPILMDRVAQVECVAGCFFLAKVNIMKELGYLDENVFLYNEENLLGIKCKEKGYKEILLLDQFYIHNHKYKKNNYIPFIKKINTTKAAFQSRKYLCKKYYGKHLVPFLVIVEGLNKAYLLIAYLKGKLYSIFRKNVYK